MNRRSIQFRLTAWYAVILAVTFTAVGIGVWLAIRDSINETVDKDLRFRLQAMRDFLKLKALGAEALIRRADRKRCTCTGWDVVPHREYQ